MSDPKRITVFIGVDLSELKRGLLDAQKGLKRAFGKDTLNFSKDILMGLGAVAVGLTTLGAAAVKSAADMAMTKQSFTALIGSAAAATEHIRELEHFAINSTLDFKDAKEGSQRLLAMGYSAKQVIPILQAAGDAAATSGKGAAGFAAITEAIAGMKAKGQVTTREMRSLISAGLPAWDILAKKIGVTVPEAQEMLKKKTISTSAAINALVQGMTDKYGGTMAGMQGEIHESLSDMVDLSKMAFREIGGEITDKLNLKKVFKDAADGLQGLVKMLQQGGVSETLGKIAGPELKAGLIGLAVAITAAVIPALTSMAIAGAAAIVPMLPFIALGLAIAGLAYTIMKNWEPLKQTFVGTFLLIKYYGTEALLAVGRAFLWLADVFLQGAEKIFGWIPGFKGKLEGAREKVKELKQALDNVAAGNLQALNDDLTKFDEKGKQAIKTTKELKEELPGPQDASKVVESLGVVDKAYTDFTRGLESFGSGMADVFTDIIMGTRNAGEALQDLGKQLVQMFLKLAIQKALFAMIPGMGGMGAAAAPATAAIPAMAAGGIVTGPTMALIGEAGPEAVIPLDKLGGGMGGGPINVINNLYNETGQPMQANTSVKRDTENLIINTVLTALANNKGGLRTALKGR